MSGPQKAHGVHFVGSVPYASAEETFTKISKALPGRLRRIPDGETGERLYWTWWLHSIFPDWALTPLSYPAKLAVSRGEPDPGVGYWLERTVTAPERQPGDQLVLKPTTYVKEALESYKVFKKLKDQGVIEPGVRFQVSIATSAAIVCTHVLVRYRSEVDVVLEKQIIDDVLKIQELIPAEDLAIQVDVAVEMGLLEKELDRSPDQWFEWFDKGTTMAELVPRVVRYAEAVHEPVELGFHFCYGDVEHEHWAQPQDTGLIMSFWKEIQARVRRPIQFIHLPVPVDRDDEGYLLPLRDANIGEATEIYLGLAREHDVDGTQRRLATAQRVINRKFGLASECGLGRTNAATADNLLQVLQPVSGPA